MAEEEPPSADVDGGPVIPRRISALAIRTSFEGQTEDTFESSTSLGKPPERPRSGEQPTLLTMLVPASTRHHLQPPTSTKTNARKYFSTPASPSASELSPPHRLRASPASRRSSTASICSVTSRRDTPLASFQTGVLSHRKELESLDLQSSPLASIRTSSYPGRLSFALSSHHASDDSPCSGGRESPWGSRWRRSSSGGSSSGSPASTEMARLLAHRVSGYCIDTCEADAEAFRTALLRESLMCSGMPERLVDQLAAEAVVFRFESDEMVLSGRRPPTHVFFIRSGSFCLSSNDSRGEWAERVLLGPGCSFGETSLTGVRPNIVFAGKEGGSCFGLEMSTLKKALCVLSRQGFRENLRLMQGSKLFRHLEDADRRRLCRSLVEWTYPAHGVLWREGVLSSRDCMYILKSGVLVSTSSSGHTRELSPGDSFGEQNLLRHEVHRDTLVVSGDGCARVLMLGRDYLEEIVGRANLQETLWYAFLPGLLANLRHTALAEHFEDLEALADAIVIKTISSQAADMTPSFKRFGVIFLLVLDGEVLIHSEASKTIQGWTSAQNTRPWHLGRMCPWFEDGHALPITSIAAAYQDKHCTLALLLRDLALPSIVEPSSCNIRQTVKFLREVYIFRQLSDHQCRLLAQACRLHMTHEGENVIEAGEMANSFCVVESGELALSEGTRTLRVLGVHDYFGEQWLLDSGENFFSVTMACRSQSATILAIPKNVFQVVVQEKLLRYLEARSILQRTDVALTDLRVLNQVGFGSFGVVRLAEHKVWGTRYALKCVSRSVITRAPQRETLQREREVLLQLDHPFLLKLIRTLKDNQFIYFLTEFVTGGELFDAIRMLGLLSRSQALFYIGSLMLALESLHERRIVYRDLKPENVLLDGQGYIKLIDFGCARRVGFRGSCRSLVGTPHYVAPEVILSKDYSFSCDVWALGICLYEFICGPLPFGNDSESPKQVFCAVLTQPLSFTDALQEIAGQSLLRQLLRRSPEQRLGCGGSGWAAVWKHDYFQGFSCERLLGRELQPPLVPQPAIQPEYEGDEAEEEELPASMDDFLKKPEAASTKGDDELWDADF
eukprot:TRINITY_DN6297_c0_g1_i1.p1 TRINITY_DN6297_c0_g1~~TRINITY_DN6297_c0_g1_i1.p1  ORF type:complete len:1071 (-),score=147.91 TRINITY_DN6297_c0_g1_i1:41-3253(-)